MSLYAVKNDEGKFYDFDSNGDFWKEALCRRPYTSNEYEAQDAAHDYGGHVVALVDAPEKVVVSENEAEILKKLDREIRTKSTGYSPWKWLSKLDDLGMAVEDAYKALAIGWTVEKPKRWNVKVPHAKTLIYYKFEDVDDLGVAQSDSEGPWVEFTAEEIEHYGLGDCQKVVCADSARTTGEVKD